MSKRNGAFRQITIGTHDIRAHRGREATKMGSYFPYTGKVCINGHEYLKRQLAQESIAYEALDNGLIAQSRAGSSSSK